MYYRSFAFIACLILLSGCSDSVSVTSKDMAEHFDAYCAMTGGTLGKPSDLSFYGVCNCGGHSCIDSGCTADGLNCNTAERRMCKEGATRCVNILDEKRAPIGHLQRCEDGLYKDYEICPEVSCHYTETDVNDDGVCGKCIDKQLQCHKNSVVNCENGEFSDTVEDCDGRDGCKLENGVPQCIACDASSGDYCANGYMNRCDNGHYVQEHCSKGDCAGTTQCGNCAAGETECRIFANGSSLYYHSKCTDGEFSDIPDANKQSFLNDADSYFFDNSMCNPCTQGSTRCLTYQGTSYYFSCQQDGRYHNSGICPNGCEGNQCHITTEPKPKDFCDARTDGVYCNKDGHVTQCGNNITIDTKTESCASIGGKTYSCIDSQSDSAKECEYSSCQEDGSCGGCIDGKACDGNNLKVCKEGVLSKEECTGGCLNYHSNAVCATKAKLKANHSLRLSPQWQYFNGNDTNKVNDRNNEYQKVGPIGAGAEINVLGCTKKYEQLKGTSRYCLFNYNYVKDNGVKLEYFYTNYDHIEFGSDYLANTLADYDIYFSTITPNYVAELWDKAYFDNLGGNSSALLALIDVLCVLNNNTTQKEVCPYYGNSNKATVSFEDLVKGILKHAKQDSTNGVPNDTICPLLHQDYSLNCDYWHRNDKLYIPQVCNSDKCAPDSSKNSLSQDEIIDQMGKVLDKGGFIIAKMDKGNESDYWGKDYHAFVIYGIDKNTGVIYIDDPSNLHFSDTFKSFFERNNSLFFVTK